MYALSVGAVFRNESDSIQEWIEHYLFHGAEHFYLINDDSTDNSVEVLQPYVDAGIVTLFQSTWGRYLGRQRDVYTHYILPHLSETKWLLMVDLDEYMWSPMDVNLCEILAHCGHLGQIQVRDTLFGSNGHIEQPRGIVQNFTRCTTKRQCLKYFVNSEYEFTYLNVHHATFANKANEIDKFIILGDEYLILNHYSCQSRNFWRDVKCTRNDGDNYRTRTMEDFDVIDVNEVEDLRLAKQNESIKNRFF
jgi:hypothetical protein